MTPDNKFNLKDSQIERYAAEIVLKQVGSKGLYKLLNSRVLIIGAGGLGCPAIQILAASGVGILRIVDGDKVELSNLPRQILHYTSDLNKLKVDSIEEKVSQMNPDIKIEKISEYVVKENVIQLIKGCDYVIEASDNLNTKFLVNDVCIHLKIPFTIAGVMQFYGQIFSIKPGESACYRCVFEKPIEQNTHETCTAMGVMGTVPSFAGLIQANEAIKSILGLNSKLINHIFAFNLLDYNFDLIHIERNQNCPSCSHPENEYFKTQNYKIEKNCQVK